MTALLAPRRAYRDRMQPIQRCHRGVSYPSLSAVANPDHTSPDAHERKPRHYST